MDYTKIVRIPKSNLSSHAENVLLTGQKFFWFFNASNSAIENAKKLNKLPVTIIACDFMITKLNRQKKPS